MIALFRILTYEVSSVWLILKGRKKTLLYISAQERELIKPPDMRGSTVLLQSKNPFCRKTGLMMSDRKSFSHVWQEQVLKQILCNIPQWFWAAAYMTVPVVNRLFVHKILCSFALKWMKNSSRLPYIFLARKLGRILDVLPLIEE